FEPGWRRSTSIGNNPSANEPGRCWKPTSANLPDIKEIAMSWKLLGLLIAALAFCTTLKAQDEPFVGVWELNAAKTTNYQRGKQTIINVPVPGGFRSSRISYGDERDARIEIHSYIFDGNFHQTEGGDPRE